MLLLNESKHSSKALVVLLPIQLIPTWFGSIIDLKKAGTDSQTLRKGARKSGVKLTSGRMVVDYQVGNEVVKRLEAVFALLVRKWETNSYCLVELKPAFALKIPK